MDRDGGGILSDAETVTDHSDAGGGGSTDFVLEVLNVAF